MPARSHQLVLIAAALFARSATAQSLASTPIDTAIAVSTAALGATQAAPTAGVLADRTVRRTQPDASSTLAQAATTRKDPAVAGILSLIIPGLGSFYAGNNTHGEIHLGIHVGAYVLIIGGANSCIEGSCGAAALGYVVLLGNDIWSIFTAVGDANTANGGTKAPPGRVVGNIRFDPGVVSFSTGSTDERIPAKTNMALRLGTLTF